MGLGVRGLSHRPKDMDTLKGLDTARGQIFHLKLLEKSCLCYLDSYYSETFLTSRVVRR